MSVEWNLILPCFEEYAWVLQTSVNANAEQKVTLTDAMTKFWDVFKSGRSIDCLGFSVKILKLKRAVQRLSGLVESNNWELQTILGLIEEASRLRDDFSELKGDNDSLAA